MEFTETEDKLIHIVMEMAYKQGIEKGMKQAVQIMNKVKADSHHPSENIYTKSEVRNDDR